MKSWHKDNLTIALIVGIIVLICIYIEAENIANNKIVQTNSSQSQQISIPAGSSSTQQNEIVSTKETVQKETTTPAQKESGFFSNIINNIFSGNPSTPPAGNSQTNTTWIPPVNPTPNTTTPNPTYSSTGNPCDPTSDNGDAAGTNLVNDPYFNQSFTKMTFNPDNGNQSDFDNMNSKTWYSYANGGAKTESVKMIPSNNNVVNPMPSPDQVAINTTTNGAAKLTPDQNNTVALWQKIPLAKSDLNKRYEFRVCVFGDGNLAPQAFVGGTGVAIKKFTGGPYYKFMGYLAGANSNDYMMLPASLDAMRSTRTQSLYWTLYRMEIDTGDQGGTVSNPYLLVSLSGWKNQYNARYPMQWFMRPLIRPLDPTYVPPATSFWGNIIKQGDGTGPDHTKPAAPDWLVMNPKPELAGFVEDFSSFITGQTLDKNRWLIFNKQWGGSNNGVSGNNITFHDIDTNSALSFLRLYVFGGTDMKQGATLANGRPERNGAVLVTNNFYGSGSYFICGKLPTNTGVVTAFWPFHYIDYQPNEAGFWLEPNKIRNSEIDWEIPTSDKTNSVAPDYNIARANNWGGQLGGEGGEDSQRINFDHKLNDGNFHEFGLVWYTGKDNGDGTRIPGYIKWTYAENCTSNPTIQNPDTIANSSGYSVLATATGANTGQDNIPYRAARFSVGSWFPSSDSASCDMNGNCTSGYKAGGKYFQGWGGTPNFTKDSFDVKWFAVYPNKSVLPGGTQQMDSPRDVWEKETVSPVGWLNGTAGAPFDTYPTK